MDAIEKLKATVVSLIEERNTLREDRDRLIDEAKDLMRERDDMREYADCERQFADELKAERDQARKCAEEMRDLYAAEIDESIAAFPFPWEDEHGADSDDE